MKFGLEIFKPKVKKTENEACLNCSQPFTGHEKFCSYCGQKNTTKKLSFETFISNLFSGFFSYDSRFWTTFIPLLTSPGKVSKDYIDGKRARFVNPFQLYLNVSIIFFLVLGISNKMNDNLITISNLENATKTVDSLKQANQHQIDSIVKHAENQLKKNAPTDTTSAKIIASYGDVFQLTESISDSIQKNAKPYQYHSKSDSTKTINFLNKINDFQHYYNENPEHTVKQALDSLGYKNTFWNNFYYKEIITSNKNWEKYSADGGKEYINKLFSYLSISLFVFLPIFTLFLMLLYIRRNFSYMEHLVFVFNTQTVFFLLLLIFYLLSFMVNMNNTAWIFVVVFLIYLFKAMRYFYDQSRSKTILKYLILNSFYLFLAGFGLVIVAAISFFSD